MENLPRSPIVRSWRESSADLTVNKVEIIEMETDRIVTTACETSVVVMTADPIDEIRDIGPHDALFAKTAAATRVVT